MITVNKAQGENRSLCSRRSYPREVVLEVLHDSYDHPTAYTVYERARAIKPDISRGTVYRNLKLLEEKNEILMLETGGRFAHYDGHTEEHSHFVCRGCGRIEDIFEEPSVPELFAARGMEVLKTQCVYYGLCESCAKGKNEKR